MDGDSDVYLTLSFLNGGDNTTTNLNIMNSSPSSNDPASDLEPLDFPAPEFKFPAATTNSLVAHDENSLFPDSVM